MYILKRYKVIGFYNKVKMKKVFLIGIALWQTLLFSQERPNVIVLFSDDHAYQACGFNGNTEVKTPNLDQLASQSLVFDNYYNTTAICAASRAQIMTGMLEYKTGVNFMHGGMKEEMYNKSYPVLLRENGYYTGFFGKFGFGINDMDDKGNVSLSHNKYSSLPVQAFDVWRGGTGQTHYNTASNQYLAEYASEYPHSSRAYGAAASDFIKQAKESGKPFCLSVYFKAPHLPSTPDPLFDELFSDLEISLPKNYGRENGAHLPEQARNGRQYLAFFEKYGYDTKEKYVASVRKYFQLIYGVDYAVGMIRTSLEAQGVADNTIIIYTSDNGYNLGAHGFGGKTLAYEEASKAPCIIYDPRHPNTGNERRTKGLVGNIDIAPTVLSYAGITIPKNMDGVSLVDFYDNETTKVRDVLPVLQTYGSAPVHTLAVNTEKWKYIYWPYEGRGMKAAEELYNKENDPLEMENLAENEKYKKVLKKMQNLYDQELDKWKKGCVDYNDYTFYKIYFDRSISWEEKNKVLPIKFEEAYVKWLTKTNPSKRKKKN
jgi:arylsulfatase A-like enzyme